MKVDNVIKNQIYNPGPATINQNGKTILVGVASYVATHHKDEGVDCGPNSNAGYGLYKDDSSNYVDIYDHVNWIKETMGDYQSIILTL